MGSQRAGMVFGALSQGLGLFAGKKAEEERARVERQWQEAMERLRMQREDARETRAIERETRREEQAIEREGIREKAATERHAETQRSAATRHSEGMSQREKESLREDVRRREETLNTILADIEERRADAMDSDAVMYSENAEDVINDVNNRFDGEAAVAIQAHVAQLSSMGAPGYEAETKEDIRALLVRNRMPVKWANEASQHIWDTMNPGLFDEPPPVKEPPPAPGDPTVQPAPAADPAVTPAQAAAAPVPPRQVEAVAPGSQGVSVTGGDPTHRLRSPFKGLFAPITDEEYAANPAAYGTAAGGGRPTHRLQFPFQSPLEKILYSE